MFLIFSLHLFLQHFVQANAVVFANTLQTKLSPMLPITPQRLNSSKKLYKRSLISEKLKGIDSLDSAKRVASSFFMKKYKPIESDGIDIREICT